MAPLILAAVLLLCPSLALAQELKAIQLLEPQMDGGRPLMRVLKDRVSSRNFSPEKLPTQTLSNMLWAAFGVNRPASGGRTAPSASNSQEMDVYVAGPPLVTEISMRRRTAASSARTCTCSALPRDWLRSYGSR